MFPGWLTLKRLYLIYSIPLVLLVVLLSFTDVFQRPNLWLLDRAFQWRGTQEASSDIAIVGISKQDFERGGPRWPWPRSLMARLIDRISEAEPAVIAVDLLYTEPTNTETLVPQDLFRELQEVPRACLYLVLAGSVCTIQTRHGVEEYGPDHAGIERIVSGLESAAAQDREMAEAVRRAVDRDIPVVLAATSIPDRNVTGVLAPYPQLAEASGNSFGLVGIRPDADGVLRRYLAFGLDQNEALVYGLALAAAAKYQGAELPPRMSLASHPDAGGANPVPLAFLTSQSGEGQFLVNFRGPGGTYPAVTALDVLSGDSMVDDALRGRIVFLGITDPSVERFLATPFTEVEGMAGVEFHAAAADTVLSGAFIRSAPHYQQVLLVVLLGLGASALGRFVRPAFGFAGVLALAAAVLGAWLLSFMSASYLIPISAPLAMVLLGYSVSVIDRVGVEQLEKQQARSMLSRYLHPGIVEEMLKSPLAAQLGGRRSDITVLFSDIRGFTTISENLEPEEVVSLLNEYLTEMTEIIFRHDGTVDKFEGDAILAFFGAPQPCGDHPERAVRSAVQMRDRLASLEEQWQQLTQAPLRIGIGINTGQAMCGNIGSRRRMEYTIIGDTVNLAARLQDLTKEYQVPILISGTTRVRAEYMCETRALGSIQVRGRQQAVEIYKVVDLKADGAALEAVALQHVSTE